jgi:transglutaminase-like putative cysteine protease
MMMRKSTIVGSLFLLLASLQGRVQAQDATPGLHLTQMTDYHVKMTTKVVVPSDSKKLQQVRVWHAIPTQRNWSATPRVGAFEINWSATNLGHQEYDKANDSNHILWTHKGPFQAGEKLAFNSDFVVRSYQREFKPGEVIVAWKSYGAPSDKAKTVYADLAKVADKIKADNSPTQAVLEFCKWVAANIQYNAAVPYGTDDIAAIVKNKAGHCGHQFAVLEQLCIRVGIPIRGVFGLNLYAPDGNGDLQKIRPDWTNIHTWAEVHFPGVGWIEVQPSNGDLAFITGPHLIQNNKWFQNYTIWVRENGKDRQPSWTFAPDSKKFVSDYGVENIIRFSKVAQYCVVTGTITLDPKKAPGHPAKNGVIEVGLYHKVKSTGELQIETYQLWSNIVKVRADVSNNQWKYILSVPITTGVNHPELYLRAVYVGDWSSGMLVSFLPVGVKTPIALKTGAAQVRNLEVYTQPGIK